jgi:hypothetical protein
MAWWGWFLGAAVAVLLGAVLWYTAFILWPAGIVMIAIGVVKLMRGRRPASAPPSDSN